LVPEVGEVGVHTNLEDGDEVGGVPHQEHEGPLVPEDVNVRPSRVQDTPEKTNPERVGRCEVDPVTGRLRLVAGAR
jgi:hypothetical protein